MVVILYQKTKKLSRVEHPLKLLGVCILSNFSSYNSLFYQASSTFPLFGVVDAPKTPLVLVVPAPKTPFFLGCART